MKIREILVEADEEPYKHGAGHPFRLRSTAYEENNQAVLRKFKQIFDWTTAQYGHSAPMPSLYVVDHTHMQEAAQRAEHSTQINGQIFGWFTPRYANKIFLSNRVASLSSKAHAAILVHEIVHYLQSITPKHEKLKPFNASHVQFLEDDADAIMNLFLHS